MANLNRAKYKEVAALLQDFFRPMKTSERYPLMLSVFGEKSPLLGQIDYDGNTDGFVIELMGRLLGFGCITRGREALWVLLEHIRDESPDQTVKERINALRPAFFSKR